MNHSHHPAVRLRLHGYPGIDVAGRAVSIGLKHGLALLATLAAQRRPIGRDSLAALLWPDAAPGTGRARLRRLVHELHGTLGIAVIHGTPDALCLAAHVETDIDRTRAALACLRAAPRLERALLQPLAEPTASGWLEGFTLGAEAFDEQVMAERSAHQAALARALEAAAEAAVQQRDAGLAETAAAALLRLEPCHEAGHAARMAARALCRDASGVEDAYFACAARLRDELGVRPSQRLEAAYAEAIGAARAAPMRLLIEFAPTPQGQVAYAAWGQGRETIVVLWGLMSNLEVALDEPRARAMLDALARTHRVVMIDRRGTGLSERIGVAPDADAAADDIEAVLDRLQVPRAWIFGSSVGGTLALHFALHRPRRCAGLLLWGTSPGGRRSTAVPWGLSPESLETWADLLSDPAQRDAGLRRFAPSVADDPWIGDWYARLLRNAGTRLGVRQMLQAYVAMDLLPRLGEVRVPTLVLQRRGDRVVPRASGELLASAIPGARLVLLEGDDHFLWHGDGDAVLQAVQRFVGAAARAPQNSRSTLPAKASGPVISARASAERPSLSLPARNSAATC